MSGVLVLAFAAKYLSPSQQGYYFTYVSLASLSLLFEFGLSSVLTSASAHKFIGLSWGAGGSVVGPEANKFIDLARYALKWYACAGLFTLLIICPLGGWYISSAAFDGEVTWIKPWILLMIVTSIALLPSPMIFIVEGSGHIFESYFVRLLQSIFGGAAVLAVLFFGGGLYAAAMPGLGAAIIGGLWLFLKKRALLSQIFNEAQQVGFAHMDLLTLQWRSTISWLAGYTMVLMYVPLLFKTHGAVVSGQMALTMNVINMTSVLASALLIGRLPSIATYIATKNWTEADLLFNKSFFISIRLYVLAAFTIVSLRILLSYTAFDERVLSLAETTVLLIGMGFYHVSGLLASYLRAYLKEPLVKVSAIAAVVTAILAVIIAPRWGSYGIVWLVFFVNAFFLLPATAYLYIKLRREWQSE